MFILGGSLGWLGWQMLKQDRALERQRLQESLELEADHMAAALQKSLADLESYLSSVPSPGAKEPPDSVVVLQVTNRTFNAFPPGFLLYYPVIPEAEEPPAATFAAGEILEYQHNNPVKAAEVFRKLTRSPNPGVRAGAFLRLGRNLRKSGRHEEALKAYSELAQLGPTTVMGLPAELMAREARGTMLEAIGKSEELRKEASLLHAALWSSQWSLLHPAWEFYVEEAQRWLEPSPLSERELNALALSNAAESIYAQWIAEPESKGRHILKIEGQPVLIAWTGDANRLSALLAGPGYLFSNWIQLLQGKRIQGALVDTDGQVMIGSFNKSGLQAVRTVPATGLPGTLHATFTDPGADEAGFVGRRRLLLSGFAVLALVLMAGSYFIMRSIDRERTVARLQSDFVSAVSHEFRTPLTSLCQLSEMLSKGRIPTEELRRQSYDILASESARLQKLVESLLDFGRIEARSFRYQYEHFDPVKLVDDLVAEFQKKAAALGYSVELTHTGESPAIHGDREALSLALRNLLDNAVKYSPDCRTVWVEMGREGGRLAIRVRDQGMGIPAPEQKEIFKRFVRGTGSRAANIQGTGIGLAMASHIIEAHDGEIRLESKPGAGSTFTILLPVEKRT
jgi:signal transduction histidine kinase/tetratricopeptide (TPR) repeat protein